MKILLAEDDSNIVVVIRMALQKLGGHVVIHAADGLKALDLAQEQSFDLILLDSMMPGKDGLHVCRELKQERGLETPIIFLSAKSQESDIREGIEMGAIGYIQKPFDPKTICTKIDDLLANVLSEAA